MFNDQGILKSQTQPHAVWRIIELLHLFLRRHGRQVTVVELVIFFLCFLVILGFALERSRDGYTTMVMRPGENLPALPRILIDTITRLHSPYKDRVGAGCDIDLFKQVLRDKG